MNIAYIKQKVEESGRKIAAMEGEKKILERQRQQAETRILKDGQEMALLEKVQILLQKTSDFARIQAKRHVEEIVTSALTVVFSKDYQFTIELDVRGKQPVAEYWLASEGIRTQLKPPDYDRGGGVADVVSLALRLAVGELSEVKGPLLLDEIGKHVSGEYAPNVAYFLKEYSQNFNRQILLITHNDTLADAGEVSLQVTQRGGRSEVTVI
jgi:DNA repair ATPase RecN